MVQAALAASQRELNMVRAELQEAVQRQPLTLPLSTGARTACCVWLDVCWPGQALAKRSDRAGAASKAASSLTMQARAWPLPCMLASSSIACGTV